METFSSPPVANTIPAMLFYLAPLLLIVTISLTVFWLDFESHTLSDRYFVLILCFIILTAIKVVISEFISLQSRQFYFDLAILISYLSTFFAMIEYTIGRFLFKQGHRTATHSLDIISRCLFPAGYLAATSSIFMLMFIM